MTNGLRNLGLLVLLVALAGCGVRTWNPVVGDLGVAAGSAVNAGSASGSATVTDSVTGAELGGIRVWGNPPAWLAWILRQAGTLTGGAPEAPPPAVER